MSNNAQKSDYWIKFVVHVLKEAEKGNWFPYLKLEELHNKEMEKK